MIRRASPRRLGVRLLVLLFSILVSGLLVEGLARMLLPQWAPRTAVITKFWRYDPRYGWSHVPGASGRFNAYGFDTVVRINSKGFRGSEVSYERDPTRFRVLLLGDSLTWGFGVEFEESFGARLEQLIPTIQTVNLAVSGYSTDQELLLYEGEGRKYRADLVIVVVAANDNSGNGRTVEYLIYGKPAFVPSDGGLELVNQPVAQTPWLKRTLTQFAWHSYVLTHLHRFLDEVGLGPRMSAQGTKERLNATVSGLNGDAEASPGPLLTWGLTARLLLQLGRETAKDGAELVVVLAEGIPVAREIADFLRGFEIDSVVLDDLLDQRDKSLHLPDMIHWSATGHQVVAAALAERLRKKLPNRGRR